VAGADDGHPTGRKFLQRHAGLGGLAAQLLQASTNCRVDAGRPRERAPTPDPTAASKELLERSYPNTAGDVYANFIERTLNWLTPSGKLGFITNRTWLGLPQFEGLRTKVLGPLGAVDVASVDTQNRQLIDTSKPAIN
jgi:Eco57I restriction-modification methylase